MEQSEFVDFLVTLDSAIIIDHLIYVIHVILDQIIDKGYDLPEGFDLWHAWADSLRNPKTNEPLYFDVSNRFQKSLEKSQQQRCVNMVYDTMAHIQIYYGNSKWWNRASVSYAVQSLSSACNTLLGARGNDGFAMVQNMIMRRIES